MHSSKRGRLDGLSIRSFQGATALAIMLLFALMVTSIGCGGGTSAAPTAAPATTKAPAATSVPSAPTVAAPSATKPSAASPAAASPATSSPASSGAPGANSAAALADKGKAVFASSCVSCHGDKGQGITGPAVIGSGARWGRFANGKALYDYINGNMPLNAPGSLPADQNLQVTSYILVENGFVQPSAPVSEGSLSSIQLKK